MKKVFEYFMDLVILAVVVTLYVFAFKFIYAQFRERKRLEISNGIIEKVKKQINKNNTNKEAQVTYNGDMYTVLGTLKIKKINFYQPILKENTFGAYNVSVVKISGPNLNEKGNVVIGGHNYMKMAYFVKIKRLKKNDVIQITDLTGRTINYYVYDYGLTTADDASYFAQPSDDSKQITLVTCNVPDTERYIVKARAK